MADEKEFLKLIAEAQAATEGGRTAELDVACAALARIVPAPDENTEKAALALMTLLRKRRFYDQALVVGDMFLRAGYQSALITTIYAQSLIEKGNKIAAIGLLESKLPLLASDACFARSEVYGLLGRSWKDIGYEAAADRKNVARGAIRTAFEHYQRGLSVSAEDLSYQGWHGTQLVALNYFSHRHELNCGFEDQSARANRIHTAIEADYKEHGAHEIWLLTAAAELSVALGKLAKAKAWVKIAVDSGMADEFTLMSVHRQLSQIWKLNEQKGGPPILEALLNAAAGVGGSIALTSADTKKLQARIGSGAFIPHWSLRQALKLGESIGLVSQGDSPLGTCFVLNGKSIGLPNLPKVLLTNAHVANNSYPKAARLREVRIRFELSSNSNAIYRVERAIVLQVKDHDCAVLECASSLNEIDALPVGPAPLPMPSDPRAVVIGHPLGQNLSFSLLNSNFLGVAPSEQTSPQIVQYTSPTDAGSSGSPVFDYNWEVVALHRAYNPYAPRHDGQPGIYEANEGVSLDSIKAAIQAGEGESQVV